MGKTVKIGPTLSQILPSIVYKTAYLGGSVCAQILSGPQRFGLRVETFKEEGNFSYNVQLSDRRELLRSSRNLDRKMTLRRAKNTPTASVRGTVSREPKIASA